MTSSASVTRPSARPNALTTGVLVAIGVTVLAWGSAFVVIRGTGPHFGGGALSLGRLLVGTVVLGIILVSRRQRARPTAQEWLRLAVFGVAWFGVYNVALNTAEQTLDAGTSAMIVNIAPILIALGAGLFLGEGIPKWLGIGAAVAFLGVLMIGLASGVGRLSGVGVLWALLAALTYAIGVLFQKPVLKRLPAAQVTWLGCVIGAVACLPFSGELIGEVQKAPAIAVIGVVYLGVVPTAVAFSTWAYALSRMPAGQLGISTYLVPPVAIILSLIFFREIPPVLAIIGGVTCLAGVALSRRRSRASSPVPISDESLAE